MRLLILLSLCFAVMGKPLTVDVHDYPPCVIIKPDGVSGFDIEILERIAKELGLDVEYNHIEEFRDIFKHVQDGKAEAAIAGITITEERERIIDFSHPYLNSGLSILIRDEAESNVFSIIGRFFAKAWTALLLLMAFLLVCALIIWWIEKGCESFDDRFWHGLGDGIWWTNTTMTTVGYGDKYPHRPLGKIFGMIVQWIGITVVFSYFVGVMGEAIKDEKTLYDIQGKEDLKGRKVAVVEGTTSEASVEALRAKSVPLKHINDCYKALLSREVDAVVYDMPGLKEYVKRNTGVLIAGDMFDLQDYGFAFRQGSELRESFNRELLKLMLSGEYAKIKEKWFGE